MIYGPGGIPIEQIAGTKILYFFADQIGSTRALTDATGSIAGTYSYDAYGKTTGHTGTATTPLQYTHGYNDTETGFTYLRARYYDPTTAQFTSRDPAYQKTLQWYAYAGNNPINNIDPTGLDWWNPFSWDDQTKDIAFNITVVVASVALDFLTAGLATPELAILDAGIIGARAAKVGEAAAQAEYATSAAQGARLSEDLAIREGMSYGGRPIAGSGSTRAIDDIDRLINTYGGEAEDWAKMGSDIGHKFPNGKSGQAHWYENVRTGCQYEGKLKY